MERKNIASVFLLILIITGCQPTWHREIAPTFQTKCMLIEDAFPKFDQMQGSIVSMPSADSLALTNSRSTHMYNMRDLIANLLPVEESLYYERGWFANFLITSDTAIYEAISYASDSTMFWIIGKIRSDGTYGTIYASIDSHDYAVVGLLDKNTLILRDEKRVDQLSLLLLDTTSGAIKSFSPSFSRLYSEIFWQFSDSRDKVQRSGISYLLNHVPWYEYQFSPDKSRVFLFVSNSTGMKYLMWDNERKKIIWEKPAYLPSPTAPQWQMSSANIAFVDREELIILTKDGEENKLLLPPEKYIPATALFKWSPDGRYLAFWIGNTSKKNNILQSFEFVIYDTKSNEIVNTCITSEGSTGGVFWSPDTKQIVIAEKSAQYVWIDFQEKYASRFHFEYGNIIGWVK